MGASMGYNLHKGYFTLILTNIMKSGTTRIYVHTFVCTWKVALEKNHMTCVPTDENYVGILSFPNV